MFNFQSSQNIIAFFFFKLVCLDQNPNKIHTLQLVDMLMFAFGTIFLHVDFAQLAIMNVFVCNLPLKDL